MTSGHVYLPSSMLALHAGVGDRDRGNVIFKVVLRKKSPNYREFRISEI
jgi:hypothetical protein